MSEPHPITRINAQGVAVADFDRVNFCAVIEGRGNTSEEAKDKARPVIDAVNAALETLKTEHDVQVDDDSHTSSLAVRTEYTYNRESGEQVFAGYIARFTVSFQSSSVDKASLIMDQLTSVEGAQVNPADFRVNDIQALQLQALKDARAKEEKCFKNECEVFGLKADDFKVYSWQVRYDDSLSAGAQPERVFLAASGASSTPPPIEIKSGKAKILAVLSVSYIKKQD